MPLNWLATVIFLLCGLFANANADTPLTLSSDPYINDDQFFGFFVANSGFQFLNGPYKLETVLLEYPGKPVYKHVHDDLYLHYRNGTFHGWVIGPDAEMATGYAIVHDNANRPDKVSTRWQLWTGDRWEVTRRAKFIRLDLPCRQLQITGNNLPQEIEGTYTCSDVHGHRSTFTHTFYRGINIFYDVTQYGCQGWFLGPIETPTPYPVYYFSKSDALRPDQIVTDWELTCDSRSLDINITCTGFQIPGCGVSLVTAPLAQPYMVAGNEVTYAGKWPWMVAVMNERGTLHCGGVLVDRKWVLTAAHCFKSSRPLSVYRIYLGAHNLDVNETTRQIHLIKRVLIHPSYNKSSRPFILLHDIALIELASSAVFTQKVWPICLPEAETNQLPFRDNPHSESQFSQCIILGWGQRFFTGIIGGVLREQETYLSSVLTCTPKYFPRHSFWLSTASALCAHPRSYAKVCDGDSGGPLMCMREDHWELVGIASWSVAPCLASSYPSIYTDVIRHLSWINHVIYYE